MFTIYLAGKVPKGKKEHEDFVDWREEFKGILGEGVKYLDPNQFQLADIPCEKFFGRDCFMIKNCDLVLVDARAKIGAGTAQEILIAKYFKIPVVSVVPDNSHYRRITFYKGSEKEYRHPFVFSTSDLMPKSFEEAADWIKGFVSGENKIEVKDISIIDTEIEDYDKNYKHVDEDVKGWEL